MTTHAKDKDKDNDHERHDHDRHGAKEGAKEAAPPKSGKAAMEPAITPMDVGDSGVRVEGIEQPTVTSLTPDTAVCGDEKDIVMTVEGTGFHPKSVITFAGLDEPTTFVSTTKVTTGVKPRLFVNPDICPVAVRNAGFAPSNEMPFTFTAKE